MNDLAKLALVALCLALIACQDTNTGTESEACTDDGGVGFRICLTDDVGDEGAAAVMLGMSLREPDRTDMHGDAVDESPAGARWMDLRGPSSGFRPGPSRTRSVPGTTRR